MGVGPILATLRHHRLTTLLLVLQVAFTCAIVCNVAFMVVNRMKRVSLPTGIAENQLSVIASRVVGKYGKSLEEQHRADWAR
ncbi:MAG TPA: ABC transporter permease, partial [Rhodanobacteraceae bacterium]|nr:ABC transporter permease [Rhodanobacteraceae bacterium]